MQQLAIYSPRQRAIRFFAEHAGYATPPGRMACAKNLADAEDHAREADWFVEWAPDDQPYQDALGDHRYWCHLEEHGQEHEHEILSAVLFDQQGNVLASLGGIIDPSPHYRRVVNAELADEAIYVMREGS